MIDQNDEITHLQGESIDPVMFQKLFDEQYVGLVKMAFRYCQNEDLSKDYVQQAFIKLWEKRDQIRIDTSIPAYLRKMVINEALGDIRTKKRREELAPKFTDQTTETSEDLFLNKELGQKIAGCIETLPPQCATVFKMSRYEEKKHKEIAEELQISPKTVENHIGKALKILRRELAHYLQLLFL